MTHIPTGTSSVGTEQRSQYQNKTIARARLLDKLNRPGTQESVLTDQQWVWCQWRNQVKLPDGRKKSMSSVYSKGI